jgi:KaiC/GvpD/RAD55 family RecA-like ATPase
MTIAELKAVIDGAQLFEPDPAPGQLRCLPIQEFIARENVDYAIKGLLPRRGLGLLYGQTSSGKTFMAFDLAAHIAQGKPWRGRRVKCGGVIYISAEGAEGLKRRLRAYLKHFGLDAVNLAIEILPVSVNLLDAEAQLEELIAAVMAAAARIGNISLIVIDTLNRTMPGGDENSSGDMSAYIKNVSTLADATDAFALIVHHTGKDESRGARGHSALTAAVDAEFKVTQGADGERVLTVTKSRDGETGAKFGFRLELVTLGEDEDGDTVTSCVVIPADVAPPKTRSRELSGVAKVALEALGEAVSARGQIMPDTSSIPGGVRVVGIKDWVNQFRLRYGSEGEADKRSDATIRRAFQRGKEALLKDGLIAISDIYVWLAKQTTG